MRFLKICIIAEVAFYFWCCESVISKTFNNLERVVGPHRIVVLLWLAAFICAFLGVIRILIRAKMKSTATKVSFLDALIEVRKTNGLSTPQAWISNRKTMTVDGQFANIAGLFLVAAFIAMIVLDFVN